MYRLILVVSLASLIVGCSTKEKASDVLDSRSDYRIPAGHPGVGNYPGDHDEDFFTMNVKVWVFDYSDDDGRHVGGREVVLPLTVSQEEFKRRTGKRKKL